MTTVKRRVYSVGGPHHLWHFDGNHKMRRFNLTVHGAIDGFTRLCIFLHCTDNNRAETVFNSFLPCTNEFGLPLRIRTDKGGENVKVGLYMLEQRGTGSVLAGRSTLNQRIERFWRDVRSNVLHYYMTLFDEFVEYNGVNFDLESHLFCVHHLFMDRINASLNQFKHAWNHHKCSSEGNRSPLQLEHLNRHLSAAAWPHAYLPQHEEDFDAAEPLVLPQLVLDPIRSSLSEDQRDVFNERIQKISLADDDELLFPAMLEEAIQLYNSFSQA